ncbi:hypothetical protein FAZ19_18885 [Sphingobacterium alkalisoli]|uniref:Uncharacterized protein n=1 Tax=Sphingobacterium alkalisoli TaxID=1874115 RepID=A0A4U0GX58_9SPHI|nr:hypothetical protein [Sphingobacterium alkalisoli]TJY63638.1 hypothetical protein FAZ19_18885 [Sphingobacterium alkalisoli]GGH27325.1 hypothetical protein GCM10011418_37210 [Sphingobacterium alkalisoli]
MRELAILTIITALSAVSCGPGFGDISRELSGGYEYWSEGSSPYLLGPSWGKQIYPQVIDYDFDSSFVIVVQKPSLNDHKAFLKGKLSIEYGVFIDYEDKNTLKIDVDFLERYLFPDSILYRNMKSRGISTTRSRADFGLMQGVIDSLFQYDPYYVDLFSRPVNYWIISHKEQNADDYVPMSRVYGPYSREDYLKKRKELGVPEELTLKLDEDGDK